MIKITDKTVLLEMIDSMFIYFFNTSFYNLEMFENGLYYIYDTSFHGSPHYHRNLITTDKDKIEIFNSLMTLRKCVLSIRKQ